MMIFNKKWLLLASTLLTCFAAPAFSATTLIEAYHQALLSDQIFQQALAQRLSDKEGVPISLSSLLPALGMTATPTTARYSTSGSGNLTGPYTQRGYDLNLSLTQTVFDMAQIASLAGARALSKQADATLNTATQDLMLRVSRAYFDVLNDEDNLRYLESTKKAFAKQLDQINQQYNVGLKTITDVYTAQASYDKSSADYISAMNRLANDKENLRVITGQLYSDLAKLSEKFPLVTPNPASIDQWVDTAQRQNWAIKSAQYYAISAKENIKQQRAGNYPSLSAQAGYDINFQKTASNDTSVIQRGNNQVDTLSAGFTLTVPLVQGGYVVASTRKAQYDYQVAASKLDQQIRSTTNLTRQSYLGVLAGVSKIQADKQTIKSTISSLEGMQAAYDVGTGILVDVLNQQQRVFEAQRIYSFDRYAYVNDLLNLKAAAGTLSEKDLEAVNSWLLTEYQAEKTYDTQEDDEPNYFDGRKTTALKKAKTPLKKPAKKTG